MILNGDRLFAAGMTAAGVVSVVEGLGYGFIREDGIIGPGFVPIIAGGMLALFGVGIIVQSFTRPAEPEPSGLAPPIESDAVARRAEGSERAALLIYIGIGVALFLSSWFGLIVSLSAILFLVLAFIEKEGLITSAIVATVLGAGTWLVFVHLLRVPLGFGILD